MDSPLRKRLANRGSHDVASASNELTAATAFSVPRGTGETSRAGTPSKRLKHVSYNVRVQAAAWSVRKGSRYRAWSDTG